MLVSGSVRHDNENLRMKRSLTNIFLFKGTFEKKERMVSQAPFFNKHFLFSPLLLGEMIQIDLRIFFWNGLVQPPGSSFFGVGPVFPGWWWPWLGFPADPRRVGWKAVLWWCWRSPAARWIFFLKKHPRGPWLGGMTLRCPLSDIYIYIYVYIYI